MYCICEQPVRPKIELWLGLFHEGPSIRNSSFKLIGLHVCSFPFCVADQTSMSGLTVKSGTFTFQFLFVALIQLQIRKALLRIRNNYESGKVRFEDALYFIMVLIIYLPLSSSTVWIICGRYGRKICKSIISKHICLLEYLRSKKNGGWRDFPEGENKKNIVETRGKHFLLFQPMQISTFLNPCFRALF